MLANSPITGKGYYLMQRGFMDIQLFKKQPYTEREAFIYLIENALYNESELFEVDGIAVSLKMGQLVASLRYLAEAWHWTTPSGKLAKDRVANFLKKLERHNWIKIDTKYSFKSDSKATISKSPYDKRPALITIIDYRVLQRRDKISKITNRDTQDLKIPTADRQQDDKPNQSQSSENSNQVNQMVRGTKTDRYLFEEFPEVKCPEEFIHAVPSHWRGYAYENYWDDGLIDEELERFWMRYSGSDIEERKMNIDNLEKRTHWYSVWCCWCDQDFRNVNV